VICLDLCDIESLLGFEMKAAIRFAPSAGK